MKFAELDENNQVIRVIVCDDPQWIADNLSGTWVETADTTEEIQGAGPGHFYAPVSDPLFIRDWIQPEGAHDAISRGQWRWRNGRAWRSLVADNVWEPGVSGWREVLTRWPEYVQPTGAHDAYQIGERITFNGQRYVSAIDNNVWTPAAYPQGWQVQA